MKKNRAPRQDRPEKEYKESNKRLREMRGELQKALKDNLRLRKLLEKEYNRSTVEEDPTPLAVPALIQKCEKCDSTKIKKAKMPTGTIAVCGDCSHRWKET